MELGSVTLKRIGFFCFPIKHSIHTPTHAGTKLELRRLAQADSLAWAGGHGRARSMPQHRRSYLLRNYAKCTEDLRFHHADTVPADSMLVRQGTSHWKAGRVRSGERSADPLDHTETCCLGHAASETCCLGHAASETCCLNVSKMITSKITSKMMCMQLADTTPACFTSYTQMLRSYAVDLATLQEA